MNFNLTNNNKNISINKILHSLSNATDASSVVFSEHTNKFLKASNITNISIIEFIDGFCFFNDILDFYDDYLLAIVSFVEISLKADFLNVHFKDFETGKGIYVYLKENIRLKNKLDGPISQKKNRIALTYLTECRKYLDAVNSTIDVLEFSPSTAKILLENNIDKVSKLIQLSRNDLMNISQIGQSTIEDIVAALNKFNLLLRDDDYYLCSSCGTQTIAPITDDENFICCDCSQRHRRLSKRRDFHLQIKRENATFKDGQEGIIIYINVCNDTNKIITLALKEAYLIVGNRQINYNACLTGYVFDEEDIFPKSFKTAGRIWYDENFQYTDLLKKHELYLSFMTSSGEKLYYKFICEDDKFLLFDIFKK